VLHYNKRAIKTEFASLNRKHFGRRHCVLQFFPSCSTLGNVKLKQTNKGSYCPMISAPPDDKWQLKRIIFYCLIIEQDICDVA